MLKSNLQWKDEYKDREFDFTDHKDFCSFFNIDPQEEIIELTRCVGGDVNVESTIANCINNLPPLHTLTFSILLPNAILGFFITGERKRKKVSSIVPSINESKKPKKAYGVQA